MEIDVVDDRLEQFNGHLIHFVEDKGREVTCTRRRFDVAFDAVLDVEKTVLSR